MTREHSWHALDEAGLARVAERFAACAQEGGTVYLHGDLGAGKTSFVRALLGACGVSGRIRSPTYSLVESYALDGRAAHHLDLYRIGDAGELEWLGLAELSGPRDLFFVEWPERGAGALPAADLQLYLAHAGNVRDLRIVAPSVRGARWLAQATAAPDS